MSRRAPPNSEEAERCVIGALLLGADDHRIRKEHFYVENHASVFETIQRMREAQLPVDAVTVLHHLRKWTNAAVSAYDMNRCMESVVLIENIDSYVEILIEHWRRRRLVEMAHWAHQQARDFSADVIETWSAIGREVQKHTGRK